MWGMGGLRGQCVAEHQHQIDTIDKTFYRPIWRPDGMVNIDVR